MLLQGLKLRVCCTNYPSQPLRRFLELRLAGLSLALACDLRIALDTAKMTTAFAKVGCRVTMASYFLPLLVGQAKARDLLFAPIITGADAFELGLVNRVVDAEHWRQSKATLKLAKVPPWLLAT